jgi:sugar lactone lactonase YvrE
MTLLPTNPSGHPVEVMRQVPTRPVFTPARTTAPAGWYLALKFWGDGKAFGGPGNIAFDSQGRVWANTNATVSTNPRQVCPGKYVYRLDPYAKGQPLDRFGGGVLDGSGFGIALDPREQVWLTNFGFTGFFCKEDPSSDSASAFSPNGKALSPKDGYKDGPLSWPQGVKSDVDGNIWIANCGGNNLVEYPKGDHTRARTVGSLTYPFDVAMNTLGNIYATANGDNLVYAFHPDGSKVAGSPFGGDGGIDKPLGAASDSLGNVWVSNSGVVDIPCATDTELQVPEESGPGGIRLHGTMARVDLYGKVTQFGGAGMTVPWGSAVDGDDNIWVANFFGERLSHLCGARVETCPTGHVGDEISPTQTGYFFNGLQRNTGVQIDASGNVWLANNGKTIPTPATQYGDGLVVFLGAAAPIAMPLVGTPK